MVKPISTRNFETATGRNWKEWVAFLDGIDAGALSHAEIARRVFDTGKASGWWAQSITVAYEQHIGRRVPGQDSSGAFTASTTMTCTGSMDDVLAHWTNFMADRKELDGVRVSREPEQSVTEKWRYWRCGLDDSSRVTVTIGEKSSGKALLAVQHEKLQTGEEVERWRAYWKALLKAFLRQPGNYAGEQAGS